jgi:hypothetical protein
MIFTIKPGFVPSLERIFHGEVEEAATSASLASSASDDDLSVIGACLIFQKKVMLEQRKAWRDSYEGFAKMEKDINLKDRVRVQMY